MPPLLGLDKWDLAEEVCVCGIVPLLALCYCICNRSNDSLRLRQVQVASANQNDIDYACIFMRIRGFAPFLFLRFPSRRAPSHASTNHEVAAGDSNIGLSPHVPLPSTTLVVSTQFFFTAHSRRHTAANTRGRRGIRHPRGQSGVDSQNPPPPHAQPNDGKIKA